MHTGFTCVIPLSFPRPHCRFQPIGLRRSLVRDLQRHDLHYMAPDDYKQRMSPTHHCSIGRVWAPIEGRNGFTFSDQVHCISLCGRCPEGVASEVVRATAEAKRHIPGAIHHCCKEFANACLHKEPLRCLYEPWQTRVVQRLQTRKLSILAFYRAVS